jgi:hypothetical protein
MGVGCSAASPGLSVLHGLIGRLQTTPGLWCIGYTPVPHGHIVITLQTSRIVERLQHTTNFPT